MSILKTMKVMLIVYRKLMMNPSIKFEYFNRQFYNVQTLMLPL